MIQNLHDPTAAIGVNAARPTTSSTSSALAARPSADDDPAEVDLGQERRQQAFLRQQQQKQPGVGGLPPGLMEMMGGQGGAEGAPGGDFMAQMMQQMMAGGAGGAPGVGGMPGMPGMPGGPGSEASPFAAPVSPFPPTPKTFLDRIFPLIHFLAMVGLALYAVCSLEPSRRVGMFGWSESFGGTGVDWKAWGALADVKPSSATSHIVDQVVGVGLAEIVSISSSLRFSFC